MNNNDIISVGDTGVITFGDGSVAKVRIENIKEYPLVGMSTDVFFTYLEGEVNTKIKHPLFGNTFPLPSELVVQVFVKDSVASDIPSMGVDPVAEKELEKIIFKHG